MSDNTTTSFRATATDVAGNTSACSQAFAYVEDSQPPDTSIDSSPTNPTNDNTPTFDFSSTEPAGATFECRVGAQAFAACTPPHTTAPIGDGTRTFEVRAIDAAGNVDATPAGQTFRIDTQDPAAPDLTDSDPDSPANDNNPEIKGSAENGSTVDLYTNATCTGTPVATGTQAAFASPGLTANVANNTTTSFRATATDAAGNVSPCSAALTYVEDSAAPAAPSITDSDPDSPSNVNQPKLKGSAEAGSTVKLYTNATCTGTPTQTGTAAGFTGAGLTVNVPADSTTNFRATATDASGNVSACSAQFTYVEDSTAPAAPVLTDSDPDSPANDNNPAIKGTAENGSTVDLYTNATCTGTPAASGTAAALASPGLTVNVGDDATTDVRGRTTDAAGNVSGCSAPLAYLEDSDPPNTSIDSGPSGAVSDNTPTFTFSSDEAGGGFQCRFDSAAFANCGSPHTPAAGLGDGPHTFEVRARDAAGNLDPSPASRNIVVDTGPPDTTIDSGPSGLTNDPTPTFDFGSNETGVTFECRVDAAPLAPCSSPHTTDPLADGPHVLEVEAIDAVGNRDGSRAQIAFTVDSRPPETTIVKGPAAETTDSTPTFEFSSDENGSTFQCSLDNGAFVPCTSPFTPSQLSAGRHTFVVRAIDPAGNVDASPAMLFDTGPEFTLVGDTPGTPQLGDDFNVDEVSGEVFVSVPEGSAAARAETHTAQLPPGYQPPVKGRVFVPLEEIRQLPMGSLVDTRTGVSQLTTARNRAGRTQTGKFSAGVFQVLQSRKRKARGLTELRLKGASFNSCRSGRRSKGSASAAALRRRTIRRVRSNAHGRFSTRGRNAAATVRGTKWEMIDRCDGTLTKVTRGTVVVRDLRKRKNVIVKAGKSYLAKARR